VTVLKIVIAKAIIVMELVAHPIQDFAIQYQTAVMALSLDINV